MGINTNQVRNQNSDHILSYRDHTMLIEKYCEVAEFCVNVSTQILHSFNIASI